MSSEDRDRRFVSPAQFTADYLSGVPTIIAGTTGELFFSSEAIAVKWWGSNAWIFLHGTTIAENAATITTGALGEKLATGMNVHVTVEDRLLAMFSLNAQDDLLVMLAIPGQADPVVFDGSPELIEFLKQLEAAKLTGAH